jgi:hypothetical protein
MFDDILQIGLIAGGGIFLALLAAVVPFKLRRPKYPEYPRYGGDHFGGGDSAGKGF